MPAPSLVGELVGVGGMQSRALNGFTCVLSPRVRGGGGPLIHPLIISFHQHPTCWPSDLLLDLYLHLSSSLSLPFTSSIPDPSCCCCLLLPAIACCRAELQLFLEEQQSRIPLTNDQRQIPSGFVTRTDCPSSSSSFHQREATNCSGPKPVGKHSSEPL